MASSLRQSLWLFILLGCCAGISQAQVVATVNGEPIEKAEVEMLFQEAFGKRPIAPEALPALQAQTLEQAVDRHLVASYLREQKLGASDEEIDISLREFTEELKLQDMTLDDFLARAKLTRDQLRRKVYWQTSWQRHLAKTLTDEKLKACFEAHRADLDGTEVRVSHLLVKLPKEATAEQRSQAAKKAEMLRQQIAAGALKFADAVAKHSEGTKANGGDLGFIGRQGSMPESFAAAAFALKKGDVGAPVVTSFGVHLILCTEIKPGEKKFSDVRRDVELLAARELFAELAAGERKAAKVEYTAAYPHFKPGTREVAGSK